MSNEHFFTRDIQQELLALVNSSQTFSDVHIEQDQPLMLKTPRGWTPANDVPVSIDYLAPLLSAIDEDWEDKIIDGAIDRPLVLGEWRLRCNVYRMARGSKVAVSIRRFPLQPLPLERTGLPAYVKTVLEATKGIILVTGPTGRARPPPSLPCWTTSMPRGTGTSSPSRNPSSTNCGASCRWSRRRKCRPIRPASRRACARRCGRSPTC